MGGLLEFNWKLRSSSESAAEATDKLKRQVNEFIDAMTEIKGNGGTDPRFESEGES